MISRDTKLYEAFGIFCICGSGCLSHQIIYLALEHLTISLMKYIYFNSFKEKLLNRT